MKIDPESYMADDRPDFVSKQMEIVFLSSLDKIGCLVKTWRLVRVSTWKV